MNRLSRLLWPALLVAVLTLLMGAVVQAAGSATIRDDAGLFTSAGRSAIERAAEQNDVRVVVITDRRSFPSESAWHAWLRGQATDPNAITIGLHAAPKKVYVVPGANTGISQAQANQGFRDAQGTFNSAGPAEGVIQMIRDYHSMGATAPGGSAAPAGGGFSWGWLVPVIIVALLAFVLLRVLGGRRRAMPGYGPGGPGYGPGPYNQSGPYNQGGGPYQGYGPGYGGGGGFGRGLMGGILGGLGGAWLGNQLFGDRGGGDVNAAGPDASQAGPLDTPTAQSMPGEWTGDGGDTSQAAAGDWGGAGGDSGWGGGDGGWGGSGDGGGWGGDGGGDGGWT
jgi:hypothetical protein